MIEYYRFLLPKCSKILRLRPSPGSKKFVSAVANTADNNNLNENDSKKLQIQNENPQLTVKSLIYKFPEFVPHPNVSRRNSIREKLERRDMLRRRNILHIPEFYVGSVLAVSTSNKHAPGKFTRFVGICIYRNDFGLGTSFVLRNVIEHQGVEVKYSLYSPLIQQIDVLRLEKRLDENLYYLRDAPNEYSTFPFDLAKEYTDVSKGIPVNTLKVPLNPRPWLLRYERMNLKGAILPELSEKIMNLAKLREKPWKKYDLMDEYRRTIPEDEQQDIFSEICEELQQLEIKGKHEKRKKVFSKPTKQKLF